MLRHTLSIFQKEVSSSENYTLVAQAKNSAVTLELCLSHTPHFQPSKYAPHPVSFHAPRRFSSSVQSPFSCLCPCFHSSEDYSLKHMSVYVAASHGPFRWFAIPRGTVKAVSLPWKDSELYHSLPFPRHSLPFVLLLSLLHRLPSLSSTPPLQALVSAELEHSFPKHP